MKCRSFVHSFSCRAAVGKCPTDYGKIGEDLAVRFLKRKQFLVLCRNWTFDRGEIDIVALDRNCGVLVFVEVKLRSCESLVPGYFAVNKKKKEILRRTCRAYLRKFTRCGVSYRFDVIEIRMRNGKNYQILHYENVKLF
ncbi:MAG: YraN family protein [Puniceicoccales bacterium]|nr:YraN family protein [Puniceicoccales bacterium]